jgi:hypothetical protein
MTLKMTCPLVREGAPYRQNRNCLTVNKSGHEPPMGLVIKTDWLTDWLTDWPSAVTRLWFWLSLWQAYYSACHLLSRRYLARLIRPCRWSQYVPPKRQLTSCGVHGVIFQKSVLFILNLNLYQPYFPPPGNKREFVLFLAYLSYSEKIRVGLRSDHAVRVCVYPPYQLLKAWIILYETWCLYHGTSSHFNDVPHKTLESVCVCVCETLTVARQRFGKHVPKATNTNVCNNRWIVGRVVFCAVRVVSNESLWVCVFPCLC